LGYKVKVEPTQRELFEYETEEGKCPFRAWLEDLRDVTARALIRKRLNRIRLGNMGDRKSLGDGVSELRIDFGPGYRVYFGEDGPRIVVLLCGGDKGSQSRDIEQAKKYWRDYLA
jgi:putative addiction module killer protein